MESSGRNATEFMRSEGCTSTANGVTISVVGGRILGVFFPGFTCAAQFETANAAIKAPMTGNKALLECIMTPSFHCRYPPNTIAVEANGAFVVRFLTNPKLKTMFREPPFEERILPNCTIPVQL
jgi:hypothetical protein